jgi:hypothetical protein
MSQQQKIAAALFKAGVSSPALWASAELPANSGVQVTNAPASEDPLQPAVLMNGAVHKTFLIAWRSQQEAARALGWKCILMMWGGAALALLSLYLLLEIKGLF